MKTLEWDLKNDCFSCVIEYMEPTISGNFQYITVEDNILPIYDIEFLNLCRKEALKGNNVLNKSGEVTEKLMTVFLTYLDGEYGKAARIQEIQQWLIDNDYRINKYILGEYTDESPQWIQYKQDRLEKISELNLLLENSNDI
ncbi:MAG: hypothetical protein ACNA7U_01235 [Candidatus Izemoplasmataceae bacterium]